MSLSALFVRLSEWRAERNAERAAAKKERDAKWQRALEVHRKAEAARKKGFQGNTNSAVGTTSAPSRPVSEAGPAKAAGGVPAGKAEILAKAKPKQQTPREKPKNDQIVKALKARQAAAQAKNAAEDTLANQFPACDQAIRKAREAASRQDGE
jgi:hypothetical protein